MTIYKIELSFQVALSFNKILKEMECDQYLHMFRVLKVKVGDIGFQKAGTIHYL